MRDDTTKPGVMPKIRPRLPEETAQFSGPKEAPKPYYRYSTRTGGFVATPGAPPARRRMVSENETYRKAKSKVTLAALAWAEE